MTARALFTSKALMIDRNFLSSALEGIFSWTATQIFRLAAWGLQMLSELSAVSAVEAQITTGLITSQPGPLSLVQECRGLALIGRGFNVLKYFHSVATYASSLMP